MLLNLIPFAILRLHLLLGIFFESVSESESRPFLSSLLLLLFPSVCPLPDQFGERRPKSFHVMTQKSVSVSDENAELQLKDL